MSLSKFLTTLGLITGLVSANIIEIPSIKMTNNATAITIPNFSPSANFLNGTLTVEIPAALIQAGLSETLRANEGEIKSTEFNKIFLSNMRATLVNGGIRVSGNWKFHHRERLIRNPLSGGWSHTPWVIEEGTFYQDFNLSVANGQLRASTNGRPDVSSSAWYGVIVDEIINHMEVRQNVKDQLDAQLSSFNGLNLQRMLIDYGANTAANQLGVNQNQVSSFINSNVGGINANFNSSRLAISLSIPSLQTPTSPEYFFSPPWVEENLAQYPMFDAQWYLNNNPDVNNACKGNLECARQHYLANGLKECRNASRYFNPRWYLDNNPDVKSVFVDCRGASEHWSGSGRREGRPGASGVPAP